MEHAQHILVPLSYHGYDLSITKSVAIMFATSAVIFLFLFFANFSKNFRKVEQFIYDFIVEAFGSGLKGGLWFSFLMTLFLFVFFSNISGLIPGGESPTSNINVTAALAILVFLISHLSGFINHKHHHIANLIPHGIPWYMVPIMFPLEIISHIARPFSLAVRLFANMFAGHSVLLIFLGLAITASSFIKVLPFAGVVLVSCFELFVGFIQAFIFTYLASFYISDAVKGAH